ncbi:hypothetical protein [Fodinicurvata sp. EGI_FJ10296]|uniref:hypothetical protein n=1 Tax=Fodinicurvata sp. EGI_FJ10296 TaxID=3231908 RepID=UPI003454E22C
MKSRSALAFRLAAGVAVGAFAAAAGPAFAQVGMTGYNLSGGFTPSPQVLDLTARGADPAGDEVRGCPGYANLSEGGFSLTFSDAYTPLRFYMDSTESPGLLVRGPDGISRCAGVDEDGVAQVAMGRTLDGEYEIWPLSGEPGESVSTRILISEYELQAYEIRPPEPPNAEDFEPPMLGTVQLDPAASGRQTLASGTINGTRDAWELSQNCSGNVDPGGAHVAVDLPEQADTLSLNIQADSDAVMMVLTPDGEWLCNDDASGFDPAVTLSPAPAGRYYVLGGTFGSGVTTDATFYASFGQPIWGSGDGVETSPGTDTAGTDTADFEPPVFGSFAIGPSATGRQTLASGSITGNRDASQYSSSCYGNVDQAGAHVAVDLQEPADMLSLNMEAVSDGVMMVLTPDGEWLCDDDTSGFDPAVTVSPAPAGRYYVLGGTFGSGVTTDATFYANLGEPIWGADDTSGSDDSGSNDGLGVGAEPAFGFIELPAAGAPPVSQDLNLAGSTPASSHGSGCYGQIDPNRPDFVVQVSGDGEPVAMRVSSDADTTLLVVDPAGDVHCNDDSYGLDPEIAFDAGMAGDYDVWVGSWGSGNDRPATLTVSREAGAPVEDYSDFRHMDPDEIFANVETARDVWIAMLAELEAEGTVVTVEQIDAPSDESLHVDGISMVDDEFSEPVTIESFRINALDVAGLREQGEPGYFDFEVSGLDYMPMARSAASESGMPLGEMADLESALAGFAFRVMPMDGSTDVGLSFDIADALGIALDAVLDGESRSFADLDRAALAELELTVEDNGFIAALVESQGHLIGMTGDDMLAFLDQGFAEAPFPIAESDPRGSIFYAAREMFAQRETGGTLRVAFRPDQPMTMDEIGASLETSMPVGESLGIEARFVPN